MLVLVRAPAANHPVKKFQVQSLCHDFDKDSFCRRQVGCAVLDDLLVHTLFKTGVCVSSKLHLMGIKGNWWVSAPEEQRKDLTAAKTETGTQVQGFSFFGAGKFNATIFPRFS